MTTKYYQKHKEELWKEAHEVYQNLYDEEKDKKQRLCKEENEKRVSIFVNVIRISLRNKRKSKLSIWEIVI